MDSRNISKNEIELKKVKDEDIEFLYELLSERNKNENISHRKMPSFVEHKKFVMSKPYSIWYIILIKKNRVGAIYVSKQNEIGIHIKKKFRKFGIGESAIQSLMIKNPRNRYLANIYLTGAGCE